MANKKGLMFWLLVSWWWYPIIWCAKLCLLPFTIPMNKRKQSKIKDEKTIRLIDRYYESEVIPLILRDQTQENIVRQAVRFKSYFDKEPMSNSCREYYIEKYENLVKHNIPKEYLVRK